MLPFTIKPETKSQFTIKITYDPTKIIRDFSIKFTIEKQANAFLTFIS